MRRDEHMLLLVMEECGELTKETSKALRFGRSEQYTPQHPANIIRVQQELYDLITVAFLAGFDVIVPEKYKERKIEKVEKYLEYSRSLGIVK